MSASTAGTALDDQIHQRLLTDLADGATAPDPAAVTRLVRSADPLLPFTEVEAAVDRVLARIGGFGPLEPLLADPAVSEVMVNGGPVWVEREGRLERTALDLDPATVSRLIERVVAPLGLRVDRTSPLVDARLPDGSRVNAVVPPLAVDGPCLTIRRFGTRRIGLAEVAGPNVAALLRWAVGSRLNLIVTGGAGVGKTTVLNALAAAIPPGERVITVEDAAELQLPGDHVVRLEARPGNADGVGSITIRDLVRNALRMRPDRIIVGETRGAEALDMVQAMNTGHEGSLSTCHANGPDDALRRLETMVLTGEVALSLAAVREQLHAVIDLIVHLARQPDGTRRVAAVAEVVGGGADVPAADGARTRLVADGCAVVRLPTRAPRCSGASAPDPRWLHDDESR